MKDIIIHFHYEFLFLITFFHSILVGSNGTSVIISIFLVKHISFSEMYVLILHHKYPTFE